MRLHFLRVIVNEIAKTTGRKINSIPYFWQHILNKGYSQYFFKSNDNNE